MFIIGITGKARSGKDTFAKHFINNGWFRYGFADPIKAACSAIFDWDNNDKDKDSVDPYFEVSPRVAYQTLGTEWGRNLINPNLWILVANNKLKNHHRIIIPDVRFENEAAFVRKNGILIHMKRSNIMQVAKHKSEEGIKHKSGDIIVNNNGDIPSLNLEASKIRIRIENTYL